MIASYVRISSEDQSKYSISDQLRKCRQKAQIEDIKEYIDEGYSGEFLDRPAMIQLRADVKAGLITKVICLDPDRLSRKLVNQLIVSEEIEKRAELIFVNGEYARTPEGMLFYQMRGAVAEFEKAKINERMSNGRRQKARSGKVVRDYQVYGYGFDKESASMYIIEEEANIVRLIFDLLTSPNPIIKGINSIALYLSELGVPTKKGSPKWHRQVVRQIILNRAYVGEFYQNRWNTEGMLGNKHRLEEDKVRMTERPKSEWIHVPCPAIIPPVQFERAQQLMEEAKRRWGKVSKHEYLLSGLLRCGMCGNTMTGRNQKNWGKYEREYTDLKTTAGFKIKGCGHRVKCLEIDNFVWDNISSQLNNPDQVAADRQEVESVSFEETELKRLENLIDNAKAGRKKLLKLFSSGSKDIGEEELREAMRDLKEEEELLIGKHATLNEKMSQNQSSEHSKHLLKEIIEYYNKLESLTLQDKQGIIRHIVKEIQVFKEEIVIYSF